MAKSNAPRTRKPPERSSEVSLEGNVMVVGQRVTEDGLEYLVKGAQEPDSAGVWTPWENVHSSLLSTYTRRQRASK